MRHILFFLLCFTGISFSSCEKVISISLQPAEKKYVIEGMVSDQINSCKVYISRTMNFDESNIFKGVPGAQVILLTPQDQEIPLTETAAGLYENPGFRGIPGNTYRLKVQVDGQTFTASSKMPVKVHIDTLFIRENTFFNEKVKLLNVQFRDPAGKGNCYRFVQHVNGVKDKTIFVRKDDLIDNERVSTQLFTRNDEEGDGDASKIKTDDTVMGEMLCIDPDVYKYWFSLNQSATGANESASPANPVTNITGGALGYFSAHTYDAKTITAP